MSALATDELKLPELSIWLAESGTGGMSTEPVAESALRLRSNIVMIID